MVMCLPGRLVDLNRHLDHHRVKLAEALWCTTIIYYHC